MISERIASLPSAHGEGCIIVGAGGHGAMLVDALRASDRERPLVAIDAAADRIGGELLDVPVVGDDSVVPALLEKGYGRFVIGVGAVGDNRPRQRLHTEVAGLGLVPLTVRHPSSIVSPWADVADGAQLLPGAVVNARARISANAIINTSAVVEHDCTVGAHAHISPGAKLASGVEVGEGAHVGLGAAVRQGQRVGRWAIVGAGAVVVSDVPDSSTVMGVPARVRSDLPSGGSPPGSLPYSRIIETS